uniref:Small ribosomal subunit protein uS15m n=1 Tax=Neogobius melanostomus TaxID=47308 RepID=A0A8C6UY07_9GOBI
MFANLALRSVLKSSGCIFRESSASALCSSLSTTTAPRACPAAPLLSGPSGKSGCFTPQPPVRHYARAAKKKAAAPPSQLSDLPPTMLKLNFAAVPLAQTTDNLVKRLLSLELASHKEKLQLKKEQLISKVQRDENDRKSEEVRVAILTARIRNYQDHLQLHPKDKANKRRMLMAIDMRKKMLKRLRLVRYDAFEKVCKELDITYTFPPEYYRRATRRWLAKKAFCLKVFKEVQKKKKEERMKMKQSQVTTETTITDAQ